MAKLSGAAPNREILEAALQGLEAQRHRLDEQIAQVRSMMGQRVGRPPKAVQTQSQKPASSEGGKRKPLSSEARKRIAAAQKKRWANFRKAQG